MKLVRKAMLSVAAGTALIASAMAFAQNARHDDPRRAPDAPVPAAFASPSYFGPAYSAAAVYDYLRSAQGAPDAQAPHGTSPRIARRSSSAIAGRIGPESTAKGL